MNYMLFTDLSTFFMNPIFLSCVLAWLISQAIKLILDLSSGKKVTPDILIRTGGMPSSHAAFVTAITLSVLLTEGFTSMFFISFGFSAIVITDAFGVRNQVGTQAKLINTMLREIKFNLRKHNLVFLKELVGHSGLQVFFGVITGIIVSLIVNLLIIRI